jgi:putative endonuclease
MTNNLARRLREHRLGEHEGFTKKYQVHRLVLFECFHDPRAAIAREKQIKSWRREKKVALIEAENPTWEDLAVPSRRPLVYRRAWRRNGNEKQIPRCARDDGHTLGMTDTRSG